MKMPHPFRHLGLKAAALGLATLLWITISGQQVERSAVVQLQFRNVPASLELSGDTPHSVDVRLQGASGQFNQLAASDVVATVDLSGARAGSRVFPLTADLISVPLGIDLATIELLALVRVADDLMRAVKLGELVGRLRVLLVGIGVQLLRKLAISLLDVVLARAFRHPQHLIGVAHSF